MPVLIPPRAQLLVAQERKVLPCFVDHKAIGLGEREIEAYAATWDEDLVEDEIQRGAFAESIQLRFIKPMAEMKAPRIRVMREHKDVIGVLRDIKEDERGLKVRFRLSNTTLGNDTYELLKDGALDQMSIGFVVPEGGSYWDAARNLRIITKMDIFEFSVVTFPANPEAEVLSVKSLEEGNSLKEHFSIRVLRADVEFLDKKGTPIGRSHLEFPRENAEEETAMAKLFNLDLDQIEKDAKNALEEVKKLSREELKAGRVLNSANANRLLGAVHAMHEVLMAAGVWTDKDEDKPKDKATSEKPDEKAQCPKCGEPMKDGKCAKCGYTAAKDDEKVGKPDYEGEYHPSKIEDGGDPPNPTAEMGKSSDQELEQKALQDLHEAIQGFNKQVETLTKGAHV